MFQTKLLKLWTEKRRHNVLPMTKTILRKSLTLQVHSLLAFVLTEADETEPNDIEMTADQEAHEAAVGDMTGTT
jgi:hypothetical protein